MTSRKIGKGPGQAVISDPGVDPCIAQNRERLHHRIRPHPLKSPQTTQLRSGMTPDEVRGDPVQPRADHGPRRVIRRPQPKRHQKRLSNDILSNVRPEPADGKPLDIRPIPIEDLREDLRIVMSRHLHDGNIIKICDHARRPCQSIPSTPSIPPAPVHHAHCCPTAAKQFHPHRTGPDLASALR